MKVKFQKKLNFEKTRTCIVLRSIKSHKLFNEKKTRKQISVITI